MLCSSSDSRPVGRALLGGLVLLLGGVLSAEPATPTTLLPTGDVYLDPAAPSGSCLAVDLLANEGELPALATEELTPGLYRAAFRLRVSHPVDRHVARMMFTISAVQDDEVLAERSFSLVAFEMPNQPQDFDLDFTVLKRGPVTFQTRTEWQALKTVGEIVNRLERDPRSEKRRKGPRGS